MTIKKITWTLALLLQALNVYCQEQSCNIIFSQVGLSDYYFVPLLITTCPGIYKGDKRLTDDYKRSFDIIETDTSTFNVIKNYIIEHDNLQGISKAPGPSYNRFRVMVLGNTNLISNESPSQYLYDLRNTAECEKYFFDLINELNKYMYKSPGNYERNISAGSIVEKIVTRIIHQIIIHKEPY